MMRFIIYFIQLLVLIILFYWAISLNQKVDFFWDGIIFSSNFSTIIIVIIFLIFFILIIQRIYLFLRQSPKRIKDSLEIRNYKKGIGAIVKAMAALSNNDSKELILQSKRIENYLKDNPLSLILKTEAARKEKKFELAEQNYNQMLMNPDTKILGLRGLLEQNLKKQDYHHSSIYAEEIYNINPRIEWVYKTFIQIIVKTKNWQKLIEINKDAYNKKIISKKEHFHSISIAKYEIALIKESFSSYESLQLLNDANYYRPNFPPIVKKFAQLLIDNNQLSRAKKLISKCWAVDSHQMFFEELIKIANKENKSIVDIINKLVRNNSDSYDSIVFLVKANNIKNNWIKSKELIKPILTSKPNKTICELMYEIEMGISNNTQKANSWKNRIAFGDLEKTWVCKNTGLCQEEWNSVSEGGFFDSLEWTWPKTDKLIQNDTFIPHIIGST